MSKPEQKRGSSKLDACPRSEHRTDYSQQSEERSDEAARIAMKSCVYAETRVETPESEARRVPEE